MYVYASQCIRNNFLNLSRTQVNLLARKARWKGNRIHLILNSNCLITRSKFLHHAIVVFKLTAKGFKIIFLLSTFSKPTAFVGKSMGYFETTRIE